MVSANLLIIWNFNYFFNYPPPPMDDLLALWPRWWLRRSVIIKLIRPSPPCRALLPFSAVPPTDRPNYTQIEWALRPSVKPLLWHQLPCGRICWRANSPFVYSPTHRAEDEGDAMTTNSFITHFMMCFEHFSPENQSPHRSRFVFVPPFARISCTETRKQFSPGDTVVRSRGMMGAESRKPGNRKEEQKIFAQ